MRGEKNHRAPLLMHTREDKSLQVCGAESTIGKNNFAINFLMIFMCAALFATTGVAFNEFKAAAQRATAAGTVPQLKSFITPCFLHSLTSRARFSAALI